MPQFTYQAVDGSGKELSGTLEAPDRPTALRQLTGKGLQPFKVAESAGAAGVAAKPKAKATTNAKGQVVVPTGPISLNSSQVQLFTEELAELLEAGMRLEPALKLMEGKGDANPAPYRLVARRVGDLVREGHQFSAAIRMVSPSFGELFCAVSAAGEAGGSLGESMKRQAQYMAASREMQGKVIVALIYPAFLSVAAVGVCVLFVVYLIPKLMGLIETTRGKVPPIAKFMMNSSEFLKHNWLFLIIAVVLVTVSFVVFVRSPGGKPAWHKTILKLPFVGGVLSASLHSQFLETLASLSGGGLPLLRGLDLASKVTTNVYAHSQLVKAIDTVRDGGNLSRAIERTALFPSNLVEMVRLGEHTGDLPAALRRAADRCARELGRSLEKVAAAMQPVIILVMAGIVGLMAYLMISIIFDTLSALRNPTGR
jgi:type II secretory pathway component PulF